MTQAIEFSKVSQCDAPRHSWLGRVRSKLFGSPAPGGRIPVERCTPHLLRDIGLADGLRSGRLLQDHRLFRG